MCQGCNEDALAVAQETGLPVETVNAVRNAYRKMFDEQDAANDMTATEAFGAPEPVGEDEELARAFAMSLVGGGAVAVVRPVLLGVDPYVLVRVLPAQEGEAGEVLAVESGGLDETQRVTVTEAALHTMRDPDAPCVLPDGTLVGERINDPNRAE